MTVAALKVSSPPPATGDEPGDNVESRKRISARLKRNIDTSSPQSPPRTPVAAALASPVMTPSVGPGLSGKRTRRSLPQTNHVTLPVIPQATQSPPSPPPTNLAFEQWLDDVSNVDICLSVSLGGPGNDSESTTTTQTVDPELDDDETIHRPVIATEFCVSIPAMMSRVIQTKLAIDPSRLETVVKKTQSSDDVFVSLVVKGREEPINEAIEGGLTPRKAFLRTAPHISRVASRLQECMRQIFGMRDFVVKIDA